MMSLENNQYILLTKVRNFKPLNIFVFFFALACERIFSKTDSIESRCYRSENILYWLQARPRIFQRKHFTYWGSEGVKYVTLSLPSWFCMTSLAKPFRVLLIWSPIKTCFSSTLLCMPMRQQLSETFFFLFFFFKSETRMTDSVLKQGPNT